MNAIIPNLSRNAAVVLSRALSVLPGRAPRQVVLDLHGEYPLTRAPGIVLPGRPRPDTLGSLARRLERLAAASDIDGVVVLLDGFTGGSASAYNVRRLLEQYRSRGKTVTAYASNVTNLGLYLGSVADRFVMPEAGDWTAVGLAGRVVFLREALEKIGVSVEVERRAEYKTAPERFTESGLTEANREQIAGLLEDVNAHWLGEIAQGRGMGVEEVRGAVDESPLLPQQALALGLVDGFAYEDEVAEDARAWASAARFAPPQPGWSGMDGVGVVTVHGLIIPGESRQTPIPIPLFGGPMAGSGNVVRALRTAAKNDNVKAVVLHVDSSGGSALASELIWREVTRTREKKPVVAVMGNVAASGGYYVAAPATRVIAAPTTVTGSIGVFMMKLNTSGLYSRLGLNPETVKVNEHADFLSGDRPLTPEERAKLAAMTDQIYSTFKERVAQGRGLDVHVVDDLARGRVYSGRQALEAGLVDEIGTPLDAISVARDLGGLPADAPAWAVHAPPKYVAPGGQDAFGFAALTRAARTRSWALAPFTLDWGG
ncbi:MAG TPA: signal peptide peptidase SppA [Deinococcales bacterium]|nr:signal peptide peptidase SppA [Deinococcales bacterium]